ncbi:MULTISPECIES: tetratricopeptide repeat-containing diguanylate cyclase [Deefgea]|uniref:diguanylate cyclase n=1 Tax=Deefgea chitinilytica TaxID=570276 RepID=A0ABS2CBH2_9NEIS|nr:MULTISPECIES: GGDEF domain-containing protein [Deefgea]MBM5571504.1 diguanylate cyclase [Deefgea chitinilytica]MBM9888737.1 diguanylate cyclase [Deefgea sp. CFH1-16]
MSDSNAATTQLDLWLKEARSWFVPNCAKTIEILQPACLLAKKIGDLTREAQALLLISKSQWALGQLAEGNETIAQAEPLIRDLKDARLNAEFENARADLLLANSQYSQALKAWSQCLKIALSIHAYPLYVEACLGIGNIFTAQNKHGEALQWHETALEFAKKTTDRELLAESFLHVAADLIHLHEYDLALQLSKLGEPVFLTSQHKAWLADWYSYRGEAYHALGKYTEAQAWLHAAWDLNQNLDYLWSQSINLMALGRVYLAQQRNDEAKEYLLLALKTIQSFGSHPLLLRVYSLLAQLGETNHDYQLAWQFRRKYHELAIQDAQQLAKEKLTNALERRIKDLDSQLFVLQTRQENNLLRQKNTADSELLQTLRNATLQDPLTGASNRRHLDQEMPLMYQRCMEENRPFTILMVDLDHFKRVNDRFGHPIGDDVIRSSASILLQSCRGGDLVARFGGEEFALLLPGAAGTTAVEVAERIRKRIENFDWQRFHPDLKVSCSIGVAEMNQEASASELLNCADQALYQAKEKGRNRVEFFDDNR